MFVNIDISDQVRPICSILLRNSEDLYVRPLVRSTRSNDPLPTTSKFKFRCSFFTGYLKVLLLRRNMSILLHGILIRIRIITRMLGADCTARGRIIDLVFRIRSNIRRIAFMSTKVIMESASSMINAIFFSTSFAYMFVQVTTLVNVFMICNGIGLRIFNQRVGNACASTGLVIYVG